MDDFSKKQEEIQLVVLQELKPTLWRLSFAGIVGGLAYTIFLVVAVFTIAGSQLNLIAMVLKALGVDVK